MVLKKVKEKENLIVFIATKMDTLNKLVGYYTVILHARLNLVLLVVLHARLNLALLVVLLPIWPKIMEMAYILCQIIKLHCLTQITLSGIDYKKYLQY